MKPNTRACRLIVALDDGDLAAARRMVERLRPTVQWFKVGSILYTAAGADAVRMVKEAGGEVFLDLKWHDIPATVAKTVAAATQLGVGMATLHALGGKHMMAAAHEAAASGSGAPKLLAVTVLTSLDRSMLNGLGIMRSVRREVIHLAKFALESGVDGVVASPREAKDLREIYGDRLTLVVPGIRPEGSDPDDQARYATPAEAARAGADFIVVGRPITGAPDPLAAAQGILRSVTGDK